VKLGIVLFNLGGPDSPDAVEPFLRNLFSDPAIISLPTLVRIPLARFIARRRAPLARAIYAQIGGCSPILEQALAAPGIEVCAFVAMRCWHPFSDGTALAVKNFGPDHIVALPLYPQYSTTTSASSFKDWDRAAKKIRLTQPTTRICCYPDEPGFIAAAAAKIRAVLVDLKPGLSYRLLLSAHGLPKKVVASGDPYQWQVGRTARALEGKGVIVAPIAFVSEHSETLVELDMEYAKLAQEAGVPDYRRAATVGADPAFIAGLAGLVRRAVKETGTINSGDGRLCPAEFCRCALEKL